MLQFFLRTVLSLRMHRYFLHLAYKGTDYHGWQIQPNAATVQETLNKALSVILRTPVETTGCGRTDTGVHATSFVAHFDCDFEIEDHLKLIHQTNAILPHSIRLYTLVKTTDDAHSRFDAIKRAYSYYLLHTPDPFFQDYTWYFPRQLDLSLMNEAAKSCLGERDFSCFGKTGGQQLTNKCLVHQCEWSTMSKGLHFNVSANRFLRGMVRAMVGTFIDVGLGKTSLHAFMEILESGTRCDAGQSVPPQGLFLEEITYEYLPLDRIYFFRQ